MARQLRDAKRLVGVLKILEQTDRSRLADVDRLIQETRNAQAEVLAALNGDTELYGLFVDVLALRMRKLNGTLADLERERVELVRKYQESAMRLRKGSELVRDASAAEAREGEKKDLESLIEWSTVSGMQGLGKSSKSR
jgi:hypothetical protein